MCIIDNISSIMLAKGLEQKALTDYLGISNGVFTDWKSGRLRNFLVCPWIIFLEKKKKTPPARITSPRAKRNGLISFGKSRRSPVRLHLKSLRPLGRFPKIGRRKPLSFFRLLCACRKDLKRKKQGIFQIFASAKNVTQFVFVLCHLRVLRFVDRIVIHWQKECNAHLWYFKRKICPPL